MDARGNGSNGATKVVLHDLAGEGRNGDHGVVVCCACAYCEPMPTTAQCRCTHPSSEFNDGVMFSGAPACGAFVPRHGTRHGVFNGSAGVAWLHGN